MSPTRAEGGAGAARTGCRPTLRVLVCAVLLVAGAAAAAEPDDSFREGIAALDQKNWTIAVASFRRAIAARSVEGGKSVRISARSTWYVEYLPHYYLGVALSQLGDLDGATSSWKESLRQGAIQRTAMHDELLRRMRNLGIDGQAVKPDAAVAASDVAVGVSPAGLAGTAAAADRVPEKAAAGAGSPDAGGGVVAKESARVDAATPGEVALQEARPGGPGIPAPTASEVRPSPATLEAGSSSSPLRPEGLRAPDAKATVAAADHGSPEPSRVGESTRKVAALYFAGRYAEVRSELAAIKQRGAVTPVLCMLDAAAAYSQYRVAGGNDQRLLREAQGIARHCRSVSAAAAPSDRLFSPAFRSFWSSSK